MLLYAVLIACAALIPALFILKNVLAAKLPWPPGPPALPIIGHLHLLGNLPHQSLYNLSKLHGPLMGLRLGSVPTIVASSPEMAKAILQTHDASFAFRPSSAVGFYMFFRSSSVGFAPHGPLSKRLRQILASGLMSSKRLESYRYVREEEVRGLMRSVLQMANSKPQSPIELRPGLTAAVNNINCRMATGKRMKEWSSSGVSSERDLLSLVEEMMHLLGAFNVGDFIPWLAWLDLQGYVKRMKVAGQRMDALIQVMLQERREAQKARQADPSCTNLLDVMLLAASQSIQDKNVPITDDNIKGTLTDVFIGGSDTSSSTIEWALADLINNPQCMLKLQEELDRVVGKSRLVEEADIPNLPYLAAILKESMRLHPVAPLLLPHMTTQECEICGYTIPAKTHAYVNTWAIGRDPNIWERPLDFWPERPKNNFLDIRSQSFEFLPFGSGRRRCPGYSLGSLHIHILLASLVQGFTWSLVSSNNPKSYSHTNVVDMSERFVASLVMAKPLCAFATPMLPLSLY